MFLSSMSPATSLSALRERIRQIERPAGHRVLPFGIKAVDQVLPGGGLALGAVHEIIGYGGDEEDGAAAAGFAAGILARIKKGEEPGQGPVLWCLKQPDLYGPGLLAHGLDPARLVLVVAQRDDELLWTIEEGLRSGPAAGLAAVVGEIGRLPMVASRRLQLAAERSGIITLLLRRWRSGAEAAAERNRPSAALTRWRVTASSSKDPGWGVGVGARKIRNIGQPRWRVELLRCRGGVPAAWIVEVADATGHVFVSAELADRPVAPAPTIREHNEPQHRRTG
ncbi:MAG TPA: damage-inducible protein [Stellaceae bacterium]|jgi:protein ImuA|nr:damage-inducible protein [Stellaceae bacterium]